MNQNFLIKTGIITVVCLVMFLILVLIGGMPCRSVDRGMIGVKQRFGKVAEKSLKPGLHFKIPLIETIVEINVKQENAVEHSEAASKDLQKVSTDVKVLYSLNSSLVPKAYDRIGDREDIESRLVLPAVKECFKAVTAKYTAEELITKRAEASIAIHETLEKFISKSCTEDGLVGLVRLDNVAVEDFKFSRGFDDSIEAKVKSEQDALRALEEKQRTITEAEAAKEKVRLQSEAVALQIQNEATAKAFKIEAESIARAEAIEREAKALKGNPELIKLRQAELWDGKLPKFTGGVIPFMDISKEE